MYSLMSMQRVKDGLRMAGDKLKSLGGQAFKKAQSFDDAYSNKIADMYKGAPGPVSVVGNVIAGGHPSLRKADPDNVITNKLGHQMYAYGVPAVNALSKYAAPIGGVTLAGKGLMDIANSFGNKADEPEENTLPMS